MLPLIAFTGMSLACMDFELSNMPFSLSPSSILIVLKEKHSLVNYEAVVIMLGCFLYLTKRFEIGWSIFTDKGSNFSNLRILRLITAFEKKSLSFIATSSSFNVRVFFSKFYSFRRLYLIWQIRLNFQKHLFSVMHFSFKLVKQSFVAFRGSDTLISLFTK